MLPLIFFQYFCYLPFGIDIKKHLRLLNNEIATKRNSSIEDLLNKKLNYNK